MRPAFCPISIQHEETGSVIIANYAPDKTSGIHVAEDENYNLHLLLERGLDKPMIVGLWQVTMTMARYSKDGTKLTPATSMALVIAESENGAISQVHDIAWGRDTGYHDWEDAVKDGELIASAVRQPLHIRGWGTRTF